MKTKIEMTLTTLVLGLFCLTSIGCTSAGGGGGNSNTAISEAKAAKKKAASVGGEWRDVGKMIKAAEKEGNSAKATKLANKAKVQAENGHKQAMNQTESAKEFPAYLK